MKNINRKKISFKTYSEVMDAWDDYQKAKIEKVLFLEDGKFGEKDVSEKVELVFKSVIQSDRDLTKFLEQSIDWKI